MEQVGIKLAVEGTQSVNAAIDSALGLEGAITRVSTASARVATNTAAAGRAMEQAKGGAANLGMAMLQVGQFADDAQYGLRAVVGQIPLLLTSFGMGMGLAGAVTLVAVGANVLMTNWGRLSDALTGTGAAAAAEEMRELAEATEAAAQKITDLQSTQTTGGASAFSKAAQGSLKGGQTGQDFEDALAARVISRQLEMGQSVDVTAARDSIRERIGKANQGDADSIAFIQDYARGQGGILGRFSQGMAAPEAARRAEIAAAESGNLRGDFGKDIEAIASADEFAAVTARLNEAFAAGRLSEEDYASALDQANAVRDRATAAADKAAEAEREKALATERAAEASRNAAELSQLEAEAKANEAQYDRRVDARTGVYGQAWGGQLAQAQLNAARRGEDQETTDARLKGQLMGAMTTVPEGMRATVADQLLQRSRGMAERFAVARGVQGDVMRAQLGAAYAQADGSTFLGQAQRQQIARAAQGMGLAGPAGDKQAKATEDLKGATGDLKRAAEMIQRIQVTVG